MAGRAEQEQAVYTERIRAALKGWTVEAIDVAPMPGGGGWLSLRVWRVVAAGDGEVLVPRKTVRLGFTEGGIWLEDGGPVRGRAE